MDIPSIIKSSVPKACFKKKGDIATATDDGQLDTVSVGPDGTVLTADSSEPTGFKWISGNGSNGVPAWGGIAGTLSDQSDLENALKGKEPANTNIQEHIVTIGNPHGTTKAQIGLGNVTNDAQITKNVGTAKGSLIGFSAASAPLEVPVGADTKVLTADSTQPSGVAWKDIPATTPTWGNITGTLSSQSDLQAALQNKSDINHTHTSSQVGLGNVTNDKQVKAAPASVDGNLVSWSGTTGDTVADSGNKISDLALANHNHNGTYEPANANIQSHITSTANPHNVTAAQVLPNQAPNNGKFLTTNGTTVSWGDPSAGTPPTGNGFRHVTAGMEDPAARLVANADVDPAAAISESKLCLNYPTHSNANDPIPGEKAALAGTFGTPGSGNLFVTDADPRNTNARPPTVHDSSAHTGTIGTPSQVGLGNVTNAQQLTASQLDTDPSLAANSDSRVPSQKAAKFYADNNFAPIAKGVTGGDTHNHTGGAGGSIPESGLSFSDVTTGNVSISRHGFVPKLPGGTTTFFRADGTFAVPVGGALPSGGSTSQVLKKNSIADGDASWYGIPYVTVGDPGYATLDAVLAGTLVAGTTIVVPPGTHSLDLSSNRSLPNGVTLKPLGGANIIIPSGRTLTINGNFVAGRWKCFTDNSADVTKGVRFSPGSVDEIYPEWWGAVPNGITDCSTALALATLSGNAAMIRVSLGSGAYLVSGSVNFLANALNPVTWKGQGYNDDGKGTCVYCNTLTSYPFSPTGSQTLPGIYVEGIFFDGTNTGSTNYAANPSTTWPGVFQNGLGTYSRVNFIRCKAMGTIYGGAIAFDLNNCFYNLIQDSRVSGFQQGWAVKIIGATSTDRFINCVFEACQEIFYVINVNALELERCTLQSSTVFATIEGSNVKFLNCHFENYGWTYTTNHYGRSNKQMDLALGSPYDTPIDTAFNFINSIVQIDNCCFCRPGTPGFLNGVFRLITTAVASLEVTGILKIEGTNGTVFQGIPFFIKNQLSQTNDFTIEYKANSRSQTIMRFDDLRQVTDGLFWVRVCGNTYRKVMVRNYAWWVNSGNGADYTDPTDTRYPTAITMCPMGLPSSMSFHPTDVDTSGYKIATSFSWSGYNGFPIVFTGASLPAPLVAGTTYWCYYRDTTHISVSAAPSSLAAIALTSQGSDPMSVALLNPDTGIGWRKGAVPTSISDKREADRYIAKEISLGSPIDHLCTANAQTTTTAPFVSTDTQIAVGSTTGMTAGDQVCILTDTSVTLAVIQVVNDATHITLDRQVGANGTLVGYNVSSWKFMPNGQQGYRTTTGVPSVTPRKVGEMLFDNTPGNFAWYISTGLTSSDWKKLTP